MFAMKERKMPQASSTLIKQTAYFKIFTIRILFFLNDLFAFF